MKPSNRHELEAIGCGALLVLVILALVCWSLYEHGYLGIAAAAVGGVAISAGFTYALRARIARKSQVMYGRYQEEEEQENRPGYEEWFIHSVAREEREEEERPIDPLKEEEQPTVQPKRDGTIQRLDETSDGEFERLMAYYFRNQGYVVDTTLASGARGADLIIAAAERRVSILLKRQDVPVGNRVVQEALGGRAFYGAYEAWLITNNTFTQVTHYEARRKGVRLVDGEELAEWLDRLPVQLDDEP